MKKSLKRRYREIELEVYRQIRNKIESSKVKSEFVSGNALIVKGIPGLDNELEAVIVNDHIVMLDKNGYHQCQYDHGHLVSQFLGPFFLLILHSVPSFIGHVTITVVPTSFLNSMVP